MCRLGGPARRSTARTAVSRILQTRGLRSQCRSRPLPTCPRRRTRHAHRRAFRSVVGRLSRGGGSVKMRRLTPPKTPRTVAFRYLVLNLQPSSQCAAVSALAILRSSGAVRSCASCTAFDRFVYTCPENSRSTLRSTAKDHRGPVLRKISTNFGFETGLCLPLSAVSVTQSRCSTLHSKSAEKTRRACLRSSAAAPS
jgi:hypothetical protein